MARSEDQHWALYGRALEILDGKKKGHARPILRMLATRNFTPAMNAIFDFLTPGTALRLQRRAAATGDYLSLYNLAIEHRNRGSMSGYRHWLARATRVSPDARHELRQFRGRFPDVCMKRWRRFAEERS